MRTRTQPYFYYFFAFFDQIDKPVSTGLSGFLLRRLQVIEMLNQSLPNFHFCFSFRFQIEIGGLN